MDASDTAHSFHVTLSFVQSYWSLLLALPRLTPSLLGTAITVALTTDVDMLRNSTRLLQHVWCLMLALPSTAQEECQLKYTHDAVGP